MTQGERADPRVVRSKATIIDACAELIAEEGFAGVSIEAVAARSGAAKTTIYRHWPSREALCIEAFGACAGPDPALPDTGVLRDDLIAVLSGLAERLNDPGWNASMTSLLDASGRDPELAALHRPPSPRSAAPLTGVLERAVGAGRPRRRPRHRDRHRPARGPAVLPGHRRPGAGRRRPGRHGGRRGAHRPAHVGRAPGLGARAPSSARTRRRAEAALGERITGRTAIPGVRLSHREGTPRCRLSARSPRIRTTCCPPSGPGAFTLESDDVAETGSSR